MATIELWGHFTADGKKFEIDVPEGLIPEQVPEGAVKVVMEVPAEAQKTPKQSLYGLWADQGIDISEEDIAEIRHEMWANFPREDIA